MTFHGETHQGNYYPFIFFFLFKNFLLDYTPAKGNGNPLQYSCLENSTDRGACRATVHGVAKSWRHLSD